MQKLYPYLAYAGALPFIICAVCLVFGVKTLPLLGPTGQVLSVYALVIASFMAGSHWGQHLALEDSWSRYLPIFSNIIAIVLWLAFLSQPFKPLLITFVAAFAIFLSIDQRLFQHELITQHYFQTRCLVTAIVISALVVAWLVA